MIKTLVIFLIALGIGFAGSYVYMEEQTKVKVAEAIQQTKDATPACEPEKIPPTKEECLSVLTAADIKNWQESQASKVDQFLVSNEKIWHAAKDEERAKSLDLSILAAASGVYSVNLKFSEGADVKASGNFDFKNLRSPNGVTDLKLNYLKKGKDQDEVFRYSMQHITKEDFGTSKDESSVHVIWANTAKDIWPEISHFALSLPSGVRVKQKVTVDLFALGDDLQWKVVGEAVLSKTK